MEMEIIVKLEEKKQATGKRHSAWYALPGQRSAGKKHDLETVKAAAKEHEQERLRQAARHNGATGKSEYLGNMVYGGLDGIITTFAVVSGVVGANLSPNIILVLGLANLLADGFSMATGAFLSAKSEREVYRRERQHISEQIVRAPEAEKESLYEGYLQQGYPEQDARHLTEIISQDPGPWVSTMMAEKLLLLPQKRKPVIEGVATFVAFVIAGSIPLLIYFADLLLHVDLPTTVAFLYSVLLSGLALLVLGAAKVFVTKRSAVRSGVEMLLVGGLAALVAFVVGTLLKNLVGAPL
jgi:VIT1/CCC1 family predicted Fe2+/Mn2+ transporter